MAYRSYYKTPKTPKLTAKQNILNSELQNLKNELQSLRTKNIPRQRSNFAELESFFMNKFILIGGCVLIGLGIGYLIFNKRRC